MLGRVIINNDTLVKYDGLISEQAFTPTSRDEGMLSVYNLTTIDATAALTHYPVPKPRLLYAVSFNECESTTLKWYESPIDDNLHHCHIDFSPFLTNKPKKRTLAKLLADYANARGKLAEI